MKKWKCTDCGHVHEGDDSPEACPACGAKRFKFMEMTAEKAAAAAPNSASDSKPESENPQGTEAAAEKPFQMGGAADAAGDDH